MFCHHPLEQVSSDQLTLCAKTIIHVASGSNCLQLPFTAIAMFSLSNW